MVAKKLPGRCRIPAFLAGAILTTVAAAGCSSSAVTQAPPPSVATAGPAMATSGPTLAPTRVPTPTPTAATTKLTRVTPAPTKKRTPRPTTSATPQAPGAPAVITKSVGQSAPDGSWEISVDEPVVSGVPKAAAINASIDRAMTALFNEFESESTGDADPDSFDGGYDVSLVSATLLSFTFDFTQDTGRVHPEEVVLGLNYDVATGSLIDLPNLFIKDSGWLDQLSTISRALLPAAIGDGTDNIEEGTEPVLDNFDPCWFFSQTGLGITFGDEQVSDHATGPVTIVIPWPDLAGVIDPSGPAAGFVAG